MSSSGPPSWGSQTNQLPERAAQLYDIARAQLVDR